MRGNIDTEIDLETGVVAPGQGIVIDVGRGREITTDLVEEEDQERGIERDHGAQKEVEIEGK